MLYQKDKDGDLRVKCLHCPNGCELGDLIVIDNTVRCVLHPVEILGYSQDLDLLKED